MRQPLDIPVPRVQANKGAIPRILRMPSNIIGEEGKRRKYLKQNKWP